LSQGTGEPVYTEQRVSCSSDSLWLVWLRKLLCKMIQKCVLCEQTVCSYKWV